MKRWGQYEVFQGYYVAHVLLALDVLGVLAALDQWRDTEALAKKFGIDRNLLDHLLDFLNRSTNLLRRNKEGLYKLGTRSADYAVLSFQIKKFLGAYGPPFASLARVLREPSLGSKLKDEEALAQAFGLLDYGKRPSPGAQIVASLGIRTVADLGCGTGTLLAELASRDEGFRGWGLDRSAPMCRVARERLAKNGVGKRVKIIHGEAEGIRKHFTSRRRASIEGLFASSLLNEWFSEGEERVITFLREVKTLFPERVLVVADYYGRLQSRRNQAEAWRHTLVHDLMQVVTGQGLPPGNRRGWESVYRAAGCTTLRGYEGVADGLACFYHVIAL